MSRTIVRIKLGLLFATSTEREETLAAAKLLTELASVPKFTQYVKDANLALIDSSLGVYDFLLRSVFEVIDAR